MEIRGKWKGPAAAAALFMLFLIWHFFDVRAGIRQTGDQWMAGLYGGLGVWLAAALSAAFFLLLKKKIRLRRSFDRFTGSGGYGFASAPFRSG